MMSSTPVCTTTPRKEIRLRGIPAHLAEALSKLESSVGSPENSEAQSETPTSNTTFTTRMFSLTTRLLEFVNSAQITKDENVLLRRNFHEIKQKYEEKDDLHLREITKIKIELDESNTEKQNLRNDLELSTASVETLRERTVELEKDKLSLQRQSQNLEEQVRSLSNNLQKVLLEKKEIKESKDVMEVELASERNRSNHLTGELHQALVQIERSKTQHTENAGLSAQQECLSLSCVKRRSLEEKLKQKIQCLESDLKMSRNNALESEKKLQALAEELRARVLEEKGRAQSLARRNSQLAAERVNAAKQLNAFEEVLNKAQSTTFCAEPNEEAQLNDAILFADETVSRELAILRRLGVFREGDSLQFPQHGESLNECQTM